MIVLSCAKCGNCDLVPSKYKYEMFCDFCDNELPLWKTKPVHVKSNSLLLQSILLETGEQSLTQLGPK